MLRRIIASAMPSNWSRQRQSGAGVQANSSRGSDVERLFATGLGNAYMQTRKRFQLGAHALPFVPQCPGTGSGQLLVGERLMQKRTSVRAGHNDWQRQCGEIGQLQTFN